MTTLPLTLDVEPQVAAAYRAASTEDQRKMQSLVALWLRQLVTGPRRPLLAIMDEMGATAQANGLTPEKLREILDERE